MFRKVFQVLFFFSFIIYVNIYHLIYVNYYIFTILYPEISTLFFIYIKIFPPIHAIVYEDKKFPHFKESGFFYGKFYSF